METIDLNSGSDSDGPAYSIKSAPTVSQFIDSKVKERVEEHMNDLLQNFDLVPKGSLKARKQKRKHHHHNHKSDRNAAATTNKSHGHNLRPPKKAKFARHSRSVSLLELFELPSSKHKGKL